MHRPAPPKRPSRVDLLLVIGDLQGLVGDLAAAANDRNPNRARDIAELSARAHSLCVEARSFDPPVERHSRFWRF